MLRLFAGPTQEEVLPRSPLTAGALVAHVVAVTLLLAPLRHIVITPLLDHQAVFLVPPDRIETTGNAHGPMTDGLPASGYAASQPTSRFPVPGARSSRSVKADAAAGTAITPKSAPVLRQELAMTELEVDNTVVRDPSSAAPAYPAGLLKDGVTGLAEVRFVVDTLGEVDTASVHLVTASHAEFAESVRQALPHMRFRPAVYNGRAVPQWVDQTFNFRIATREAARTSPDR